MTPAWYFRDIYPGETGPDVISVQRLLGAVCTGVMDEDTLARVRGFQRGSVTQITGVVDHATARRLGDRATYGLLPTWFEDGDFTVLPIKLHCADAELPNALRRFQSHHHIKPTGAIDAQTAIALGD